jgi:phosphatidylglycerophosphate synthase
MLALILGSTREKNEHPSVDPPLIVGGLSLVERAVLAAQRAGVWRSVVVGVPDTGGPMAARLRARGANVTFIDWPALPSQDFSGGVLLIRHSVLVEPRALGMLLDRSGTHEATDGVLVAGGSAGDPDLAFLPGSAAGVLAGVNGADDAMQRVARLEPRREVSLARFFCRRLESDSNVTAAETAYVRYQNGRESFFTKKIRRFSVPLSRVLVRRGVTPNQVTLMGLLLAIAAAIAVSLDVYIVTLAGALLYYGSMILDCSDGEVARLSFRDSRFGAWFETVVDYVTYFLLLGGLVLASQRHGRPRLDVEAAIVALIASLVVVAVAGYLRLRVAGDDPGQFDDASAAVLRRSTKFHRFARWGRQWIKRSTIAHLIVAFAIVNQLWMLIYLWAFGAVVAAVVIIGVEPFVVRRVKVAAPGARA